MKLKEKYDKANIVIAIIKDNTEVGASSLKEFPYFYSKRYQLWDYFEYEVEEKKIIENMTLEQAYSLGNKELEIKSINEKTKVKPDNSITNDSK